MVASDGLLDMDSFRRRWVDLAENQNQLRLQASALYLLLLLIKLSQLLLFMRAP